MGEDCSGSRIWMILAITFIAVSVGLAAYLVYDKEIDDDTSTEKGPLTPNEADVLDRYPTYFRTAEEQRVVESTYEKVVIGGEKPRAPLDKDTGPRLTCNFSCYVQAERDENRGKRSTSRQIQGRRSLIQHGNRFLGVLPGRAKRQATTVEAFHGCCISIKGFTDPEKATRTGGGTVTVVQYERRRQYFPTETCRSKPRCSGCACAQEPALHLAVIEVDGQFTVDFIELPGCCKCFNNL